MLVQVSNVLQRGWANAGHLQMSVPLLEGLVHSNVVQDNKLAQVIDLCPELCEASFTTGLRVRQHGLHQH